MKFGLRAAALSLVAALGFVGVPVARASATGIETSSLVPLRPCRLVDTRTGSASSDVYVDWFGLCGIPAGATALAVTVTAVDAKAAGYLTLWSGSGSKPGISNLNWSRQGETRANSAIVALNADDPFIVSLSRPTDFIVDVTGAFMSAVDASEGRFVPTRPMRAFDTRSIGVRLAAGSTAFIPLPDGIAGDAAAIAANITLVKSGGAGFVGVAPHGVDAFWSSALNVDAAQQTRAASVIVGVANGGLDLYTSTEADAIVDITGWFTGPSATRSSDGLYVPLSGIRVLDTRNSEVVNAGGHVHTALDALAVSPAAIVANLTMVDNADEGWLAAFAWGTAMPDTSNVNTDDFLGSTANLAVLGVTSSGITLHSSVRTHVVVDVVGWFTGNPMPATGSIERLSNEPARLPEVPNCSYYPTGRSAIVDRVSQVAWLCRNGQAASTYLPFTAGPINDAPKGEYRVYFRRISWFGGGTPLQRFVAFTRGDEGGRVAFHRYVSMPESSIGSEEYRNQSSGCLRLRTKDAIAVWNFLQNGDRVRVLNNA